VVLKTSATGACIQRSHLFYASTEISEERCWENLKVVVLKDKQEDSKSAAGDFTYPTWRVGSQWIPPISQSASQSVGL